MTIHLSSFTDSFTSNSVNGTSHQNEELFPTNVQVAFTAVYIVTILLALVGNTLVILILWRRPETRRLTSFMYVNLAVADLLVSAVVMPQSMVIILTQGVWFDGPLAEAVAKLILFVFYVALAASVFTLTAVAFDSFFNIAFPMRQFSCFRNKKILIPFIWFISMCLMWVWLLIIKVEDSAIAYNFSQFGDIQSALKGVYLYISISIYVLPLAIMTVLYGYSCLKLTFHKLPGTEFNSSARLRASATKRQVIRMSMTIVIVFALCWFPVHAYHVILATDITVHSRLPSYVMLLCFWCGHANSAVNPWLLIYQKKKFRAAFQQMLGTSLSSLHRLSPQGSHRRSGNTKPAWLLNRTLSIN